jgi:hypothetical protein
MRGLRAAVGCKKVHVLCAELRTPGIILTLTKTRLVLSDVMVGIKEEKTTEACAS